MIVLTYHAVEQYISRFDRSLTAEAAWDALESQLPYADRLKQRSLKGDVLWRLPSGVYLVTKPAAGGKQIAVTVLRQAEDTPRGRGPTEEEMEMLLEHAEAEPRQPHPAGGTLRVYVEVEYALGIENEPIFRDRLVRAISKLVGGIAHTGLAQGKIVKYIVEEEKGT